MTVTVEHTATRARKVGVAVLLVYGLQIPVPRAGQPGFRLTVQRDGAVWCEPVGYGSATARVSKRLQRRCREIGLRTTKLAMYSFVVRRNTTPQEA